MAAPDGRVAELPLIGASERDVLATWSRGRSAPRASRCLHELFEEQAALRPGAIAVESEEGTMTYGQLDDRASGLARRLRARGSGRRPSWGSPSSAVSISPAALLGILKAGGAYVPIDLEYPPERIAFMLEDAAAQVVVTSSPSRRR